MHRHVATPLALLVALGAFAGTATATPAPQAPAPATSDDALPRLSCETSYTDRGGRRVSLPLRITFAPMGRGTVPLGPDDRVLYGGATFAFAGHSPVRVTQVVPGKGEPATARTLQSLFVFDGRIFAATTTRQDLAATVATVEIALDERLAQSDQYRGWTARCRQVTGFLTKRP